MHGDQVLVELGRKKEDGRGEGKILRVLTRGNPTVVGTFHRGPRNNYVTPIDEKVQQQIIIPRGLEWPSGHDSTEGKPGAPFNPPLVERETSRKKSRADSDPSFGGSGRPFQPRPCPRQRSLAPQLHRP